MANTVTNVNPLAFGANAYTMGMANFANQYAATDAESFYNTSIFHPLMGGYGAFGCMDPSLMGMMGMYSGMMGMNPAYMMSSLFSPQAYIAAQNGKSPYAGIYFNGKTNAKWQQFESNANTLEVGLRELHSLAKADKQDTFKTKFAELLKSQTEIEKYLSNGTIDAQTAKERALNRINQEYSARSGGKSLGDVLEANGDGSFVQGMKNLPGCFGLFDDKTSVYENIAMVNNTENDKTLKREKTKEVAGTVTATAAGAYAIAKVAGSKKVCEFLAKHTKGPARIIGLAALAAFAGITAYNKLTDK